MIGLLKHHRPTRLHHSSCHSHAIGRVQILPTRMLLVHVVGEKQIFERYARNARCMHLMQGSAHCVMYASMSLMNLAPEVCFVHSLQTSLTQHFAAS